MLCAAAPVREWERNAGRGIRAVFDPGPAHPRGTAATLLVGLAPAEPAGSSAGDQPQPCDLRRRAEPLRRTPVTCSAAHVDPEPPQPVQPGGERLLEAHEEHPGQELPAV